MRTVTYPPTATEAIVVDKHKLVAPPPEGTLDQSLIGKKPPQFREAASPISSADAAKFAGTSLIISTRGAAAASVAGSHWSYYGSQVSEHGEYTEMQRVYVASLAAMSTQREYRRSLPFF